MREQHQRRGSRTSPTTSAEATAWGGRADQTGIRRANLAAVLRALREEPRTRARLAADLGLTRATVSSLVEELGQRGLGWTSEPTRRGTVGRPGQRVELTPARALGVGLEINVDHLAVRVLDLVGTPVAWRETPLDVSELCPTDAIDAAATLVERAITAARCQVRDESCPNAAEPMVAGVAVAVPGLIDRASGTAYLAPNLDWSRTPVRDEVERALDWSGGCVVVDNEANLATLGEAATAWPDVADLLYLTGGVGVGGGVISNGGLVRGAAGFAGEVGHLTIDPDGRWCGCGRRGCWETLCGVTALLEAAADPEDPVRDVRRELGQRMAELVARARQGDARTREALERVGHALGLGASILVNVVNPAVLVLGGYFAALAEFLVDPVRTEIDRRVIAPDGGGCQVVPSRLGLTAAVTGAAHAALEPVLDDPTRVPPREPDSPSQAHVPSGPGGAVRHDGGTPA